MTPIRLTRTQACAAILSAQGLNAPRGELIPTVEKTGFIRTLGGVEVYLAARARVPTLKAKDLDIATAERRLSVVPTVRGCIYLVAQRDVPVSLRTADLLGRSRLQKEREKAGIKKGELEKLGDLAVETLTVNGAMTADALRKAMPESAVRSLGDKGKKAGLSSTLPPALRVLELAGRVERTLENGRLDSERYKWRATTKNTLAAANLPQELADLSPRLAEIFLRAAGIARVDDFMCWSGLNKRDASAGLAKLKTRPVVVEGFKDAWLSLSSAFVDDAPSADEVCTLLGFEDNAFGLNVGTALFADPVFHSMKVPAWGSATKVSLAEARHLSQRPVIADGRMVGFWDYDPDVKKAVFGLFEAVSKESKRRLDEQAAGVSTFLATELGHGRSFSLDTDDELRARVAFVKTLKAKVVKRKSAPVRKAAKTATKKKKR